MSEEKVEIKDIQNILYVNNADDYVFSYEIKEKDKVRNIITYKKDKNGRKFRRFHNHLLYYFEQAPSSEFSFAYKKGVSTKDAFKPHMNSNLFIRLDISHFFESITYDNFVKQAKDVIDEEVSEDFKACFYHGNLSLGFVTSPKISDIYMYKFDKKVEEYLKSFNTLHYSRYCDDILISSEDSDFGQLHTFKSFISKNLKELGLEINDKKTREFDIEKDVYVKFLGLNLVGKPGEYDLTISKSFVVNTIKKYKKYYDLCSQREKDAENDKLEYMIELYNSICRSRVFYIKNNSDKTYTRFLKKYRNAFGKEWK